MSILLELNKISLNYGENNILSQVDLSVKKGQILTIIGPNGAGKTSLLYIALGLTAGFTGTINRYTQKIGYVPQSFTPDLSLPMQVKDFLSLSVAGVTQAELTRVLREVEIGHILSNSIHNISGGEKQRLLLARALLHKPELLVLDEPAQGVDLNGQNDMYALINNIKEQHNCGILMVSHDLTLVMANSDEVICLNKHVCCSGQPEEVSKNKEFMQLFGNKTAVAVYAHNHNHKHDLHGEVVCESK